MPSAAIARLEYRYATEFELVCGHELLALLAGAFRALKDARLYQMRASFGGCGGGNDALRLECFNEHNRGIVLDINLARFDSWHIAWPSHRALFMFDGQENAPGEQFARAADCKGVFRITLVHDSARTHVSALCLEPNAAAGQTPLHCFCTRQPKRYRTLCNVPLPRKTDRVFRRPARVWCDHIHVCTSQFAAVAGLHRASVDNDYSDEVSDALLRGTVRRHNNAWLYIEQELPHSWATCTYPIDRPRDFRGTVMFDW